MKITGFRTAVVSALLCFAALGAVQAQGTVTFNEPWADGGISYFGLRQFGGISFRIGTPPPHDGMSHVGATGPAGYPHNGTPYIAFENTLGTSQYVVLGRTNAQPFGLLSVDLADPVAPSLEPVSITFNGFKTDGSAVSQTFTVGGGGSATFRTFLFNGDFALGLSRVEIPSPYWAMDNLVWIPEPSTAALFFMGLLAWTAGRKRAR